MADPYQRLRRFLRELKRRKVYRVAITYIVVAAGAVQLVNVVVPMSRLPGWSEEFFLALAVFGFPLALVLGWAFEVTPEGVRRSEAAEGESEERGGYPWIGLALAVMAAGGIWLLATGERGESPGDAPGLGPPDPHSIAVLPFDDLSGGDETQSFVDGIHDDLLIRLSNVSDLHVISRTSVLPYRETELSLPAIADSLGVRWVLEGAVQEAADEVQVNAQLIEAEEDVQRWAESYRRRLTTENIFAIQGELTKKIARSLAAQLTEGERRRVERQPTEDLSAYRRYLRGRSLLDQRTETGMRQAARWFHRAIARDSGYSTAWAGLADALVLLHDYGHVRSDTVLAEARRAVGRALALDPRLAEAYASRGLLNTEEGQGPAAVRDLRRAAELRPSYAEAHNWLSWLYLLLGRPERALERSRRAVELSPNSPEAHSNRGLSYLSLGRPARALDWARRARDLQSHYATASLYEATALLQLDRPREARAIADDLEVSWAPSAPRATLALTRIAEGDSSAGRTSLDRLEKMEESPFYSGLLRAALGEREPALSAFERVDGWGRSPLLAWPNLSLRYLYPGALGSLRGDSRFRQLLRRIDRAWGLDPDGGFPDSPEASPKPEARSEPEADATE